jgi:hypothetical protein
LSKARLKPAQIEIRITHAMEDHAHRAERMHDLGKRSGEQLDEPLEAAT